MDSVNNISFKLLGIAKHLSSSSFLVDVLNLRRSKLVLYLKFTGRTSFKGKICLGREMKENNFWVFKVKSKVQKADMCFILPLFIRRKRGDRRKTHRSQVNFHNDILLKERN